MFRQLITAQKLPSLLNDRLIETKQAVSCFLVAVISSHGAMSSIFVFTRSNLAPRFLCAFMIGALGGSLNLLSVSLGWGLTLVFGQIISLVCFRALGPWPGALAHSVAALATFALWNHPWAWLVWTFEGIFLAVLLGRRKIPLPLADFLFWIVAGSHLLFLTYGQIMGMSAPALYLVVVKQALNALVCAVFAEIVYLIVSAFIKQLPRIPVGSSILAIIATIILVPQGAYVFYFNHQLQSRIENEIKSTIFEAFYDVKRSVESRHNYFDSIVAKIAKNAAADPVAAETINQSLAVVTLLDSLVVEDTGEAVLRWDRNVALESLSAVGMPERRSPDFMSQRRLQIPFRDRELSALYEVDIDFYLSSVADIVSRDANINPRALFIFDKSKKEIIFESVSSDFPTSFRSRLSSGDIKWQAPGLQVTNDEKFGISLMTSFADGVYFASGSFPLFNNAVVMLAMQPKAALTEGQAEQLSGLLLALVFLGTMTVAGGIIGKLSENKLSALLRSITALSENMVEPNRAMSFDEISSELVAVARRLTEKESEIVKERKRLTLLSETAALVTYSISIQKDGNSRVLDVSDSILRVFGYEADEVFKPNWWSSRVHPDDLRALVLRVDRSKGRPPVEYRFRHKNGDYVHILDTVFKMSETEDETMFFGFASDISKLKNVQAQLAQSARLATLGEMATSMAHELNQPLAVIKLAATNLHDRYVQNILMDGELHRRTNRIMAQVDRASEIISYLRIFGRAPDSQAVTFSLSEVIDGVNKWSLKELSLLNIRLETVLPAGKNYLLGNRVLIEQVLFNLVLNAKDSILEKQVDDPEFLGQIVIEVRYVRDRILITVSDNGMGISDDVIDKVFDPFVTTKPVGKGTGLGLSVSFGIVRDLGGTIRAANLDQGAQFEISFPVPPVSDAEQKPA